MNSLLEKLAALEHEQWIAWTKGLASKIEIPDEILKAWKKQWVDYQILTEKQKDKDRFFARKVLEILSNT